jgi:hypothetical protein
MAKRQFQLFLSGRRCVKVLFSVRGEGSAAVEDTEFFDRWQKILRKIRHGTNVCAYYFMHDTVP